MWAPKALLSVALTLVLSALLMSSTLGCQSQAAYPTKAIELVVVFGAGGGSDVAARVMAKHLSNELKQPVNVVNKPGGNQIPGVLSVLQATPDGYTLLVDQPAASSTQATVKDLPYKLEERTFGPMMAAGPHAFAVNGKSPWNTLADMLADAKKDPESFTWQRAGGTALGDFAITQLLRAGGVDVSRTKPVDFASGGEGMTAAAGGHIKLAGSGPGSFVPMVQSGDLKVLAVTGDKRVSVLPDVPSAKEAGFPENNLLSWYGISGPKGLPQPVLDRLDSAVKKICQDPAFAKDLEAVAAYPNYMSPQETREYVLKEVKTYVDLAAVLKTQ